MNISNTLSYLTTVIAGDESSESVDDDVNAG